MANLNEILARARARKQAMENARFRAGPMGAATAAGLGAADRLTFGFGDEIAGLGAQTASAMRYLSSPLREEIRKAQAAGDTARVQQLWQMAKEEMARDNAMMRQSTADTMQTYERAHPWAYTSGEIAGSVPAAAAAGMASTALAPAGSALPLVMGTEAGLAGADAALYSAGKAEPGQRAEKALEGGLMGAAIGGAMPLVGAAARKGVEAFAKRVTFPHLSFPGQGVGKKAVKTVLDEMSNSSPLSEIQQRARLAGKLGTLMDADYSAARIGKGIYQSGVPARNKLSNFLMRRHAGAYGRMQDAINSVMGKPQSIDALKEQLTKQAYAKARPFYEKAAQKTLPLARFQDLAQRPTFRAALRKAARKSLDEGHSVPKEVMDLLRGKPVSPDAQVPVTFFDYVQRALNDKVSKAAPDDQRIFTALRKAVLKQTDAESPAFATARHLAKSKFDFDTAVDTGRAIFSKKLSPEDLAVAVKNMTPEELKAAIAGARPALRDAMDYAHNPAYKGQWFMQAPARAQKLEMLLGPKAKTVMNAIDRESMFKGIKQFVLDGSHTAQNISSQFNPVNHATAWQAVMGILKKAISLGTESSRKDLADQLVKLLTDQGQMRDQVLGALDQAVHSREFANQAGKKTADFMRKWVRAQMATPVIQKATR